MEHFFSPNSRPIKKSSPKMEHFSPNLSADLRSDIKQSQIIGGGGCRCGSHSNYWGDTVKLLVGYIPPPPGFRHPWL